MEASVLGESRQFPTRQFTDKVFEDSSPTELKTVHRHFQRQFTDKILYCIYIREVEKCSYVDYKMA